VAGGTYEYGYEALGPWWGFTAGWLFLMAKTASAATAALGVALYLGVPGDRRLIAVVAVVAVSGLVLAGLRRTTAVNIVLVTVTIIGLLAFSFAGLRVTDNISVQFLARRSPIHISALLPAIAFLFVTYTGYGRIATLGEEVHRPARTIPRAVIVTLTVSMALYWLVELGGRAVGGSRWGMQLSSGSTPADLIDPPLSTVVSIGAVTAMLGVLLNLVLGLSRVWLCRSRSSPQSETSPLLGASPRSRCSSTTESPTSRRWRSIGDDCPRGWVSPHVSSSRSSCRWRSG
jgi:APA family basic amino acid/polyamine antiporter